MVDRAAAGETAGERPAVALKLGRAAFLPRVLVAADDDRVLILPEVENAGVRADSIGQILFKRQVAVRVGADRLFWSDYYVLQICSGRY